MKFLLSSTVSIGLLSQVALGMSSLVDGHFKGKGSWKSDAAGSGDYTVETTIVNNRVCTHYSWDGDAKDFCLQANFLENGFFTVDHGWGYCYDYQCHYQIDTGSGPIEETLTFVEGSLYKTGSKKFGQDPRIVWQEALTKAIRP